MNQLKGLIKANLAKDALDIIFWGDPTQQTFKEALLTYQSSSRQTKSDIEQRAYRKLEKSKQPKIALAILCFLDFIISAGYPINLQDINPTINTQVCKNQKQRLGEFTFFNFYFGFLKNQARKPFSLQDLSQKSLEENVKYCEIAVKSIFSTIMSDYIIDHSLAHSNHRQLTTLIVKKLINHIAKDLLVLKDFITKNWRKILEENELSFRINEIYEKTIFFSKQAEKLQKFKRKTHLVCTFNFYKLIPEQNKQIEQEILRRANQHKQFISEKNIKFKSSNDTSIIPNFPTCPEIVYEDSIVLMDDDSEASL